MKRVLLLLSLFLAACGQNPSATTAAGSEDPGDIMSIRYLALGDSYTIGESVPEGGRFPNQLASLLAKEGHPTEVKIIARTGWTTSELWDGIQKESLQPPYDLVSLLIGVNNQYRGYDSNEYREEFRFLLEKSIEYAGGDPNHVFVFSIPDWGVTPFATGQDATRISNEIDLFNSINRDEAEKAAAHYVDITPISREALNDKSLIAPDGLHPSGSMYAQWAQLALPDVLIVMK
jgi:lysophospholipase L1-like esterase